jgi:hypothetical protein
MVKAAGVFAVLVACAAPQSATGNLLVNGDARRGVDGWKPRGMATVETFLGVPSFTVRYQGAFFQEIALTDRAVGTFAVLLAKGQSDRVNADASITGLPYLYATVGTEDRKRIIAYWQGQDMLARPEYSTEWVPMSGVFQIPKDARFIYVQLKQAERKDSPQDGSAARFADVQFHLFETEAEAKAFVKQHQR